MKNKTIFILFSLFFFTPLYADNILIEAKNISIDKKANSTIFKNDVTVVTKENYKIQSQYGKYNKDTGVLIIKDDVKGMDNKENIIETDHAEYDEKNKILNTIGPTRIFTSDKYTVEGENLQFDDKNKIIKSKNKAVITDQEKSKIYLENFEYLIEKNIFKSVGLVKVIDRNENSYEFSQIYIDTKKKEILGTDSKIFFNQEDFKINKKNKPRVFANTTKINKEEKIFKKNIFTICDYRENDKCPPWTIQSSEMLHDNKKKTIFYKNAVIKVYDIPIFYIPRISHPDPTVKRRSGFLPPTLEDTKNLGAGITLPYFFAVNNDKNFTLTNRFYTDNHPLFLGEYHQAFKNSHFLADFGYTEGFKKTNSKKKAGRKSHFFAELNKNFKMNSQNESSFSLKFQEVSNDKYLKLYKLNSSLTDYMKTTLENSIDFTYEQQDLFFGFNSSIYEKLDQGSKDRYEYIYPDITLNKNLLSSNNYGSLDLQTNYKVKKYETNKFTNFLVNDFNWNYDFIYDQSVFTNEILGHIKNINYETKNLDIYKNQTTSELHGAIGFLTRLDLKKKTNSLIHKLSPKIFLRHAPGNMRKESDENGSRLDPLTAFSLDRLNNANNFESGLSGTIGFDYKASNETQNFDFSIAQVVNEKENKNMSSKTSLDEKLSDLVGTSIAEINENIKVGYNFSVDQNYQELNYSDLNSSIELDPMKIGFNYILEDKHIGDQEYFKTKFDYNRSSNGLISFEAKRNLITDSYEFYNLGYEYINDCLRAGLVYRREFYNDSEIEAENSLMFKITLTPFGSIESSAIEY